MLFFSSCDRGLYYEISVSVVNLSTSTLEINGFSRGEIKKSKVLEPGIEWITYQDYEDGFISDPYHFTSGFEGLDSVIVKNNLTNKVLVTYYNLSIFHDKVNPAHDPYEKESHTHALLRAPSRKNGYGLYRYRFLISDIELY
jgi:hypothetical protein